MVNIKYGEHSQQVELTGKTVADVRELFKSEFDLSARAQANLNGQWLKRKLEAVTELCDEDELYFEEKSSRPMVLAGAFLLALAITAGLFAYTATTDTITIGVTAGSADFAELSANTSSPPAYSSSTLTGSTIGKINAGVMFDVTKDSNYTGDIELVVSLANADELVQEYKSWMMRIKLTDGIDTDTGYDTANSTQVISLKNPSVTFSVDSANLTVTRYIHCIGGSYKTLSADIWAGQGFDPLIFAEVAQAGAP